MEVDNTHPRTLKITYDLDHQTEPDDYISQKLRTGWKHYHLSVEDRTCTVILCRPYRREDSGANR